MKTQDFKDWMENMTEDFETSFFRTKQKEKLDLTDRKTLVKICMVLSVIRNNIECGHDTSLDMLLDFEEVERQLWRLVEPQQDYDTEEDEIELINREMSKTENQ